MSKISKTTVIPAVILALLYFLTGKLSLLFLHGNSIVNVGIFASEGIALGFILFFGKRVWPGIFIGQLFLAMSNDIPLLTSFGIATVNSVEGVIGYYLFQKFKLDINLKVFRDIFGLVGIILFIQLISASFSNALLLSSNVISDEMYLESSFSWWFGNIMGQLLFTPFLLLLFKNFKKINLIEYLIYIYVFALFVYFLEVVLVISNALLLLGFSISVLVFIVSHKGFTYGATMSVVLAFVSSYSVYLGIGVFQSNSTLDNVINYNLFILAHISMVFIIGVFFEERKKNIETLKNKITDEVNKNREQQLFLLQQSRQAQMGEMIAMIAHQWRQPLNNLSLANQLLVSKYTKGRLDDKAIEYFQKSSNKQITHMSNTIDDFRNFFKSERIEDKFNVNEVIHSILNIVQNIYATNNIKLSFLEDTQYYSSGYPSELGQAILNIINNAKDALLEIETKEKFIQISLRKENNSIVILIEDNAGGISDTIADKIFDPYFSTKKSKNGTGLGLYMTKMIITDKLNGEITFLNTPDGVIFKITLKEYTHAS